MKLLPIFHARTRNSDQLAYAYLRIPEGWDQWTYAGVRYRWQGESLIAESDGSTWRFDPWRSDWVRSRREAA
jgi:hypothetical protein